jgi:hypothetical protein
VNTGTDCDRVRQALMASLDRESDVQSASDREHLQTCSSCRQWQADLRSMNERLQVLSYRTTDVDLWRAVEVRIRQPEPSPLLPAGLWAIGAAVLGWRALQLFIDLPIPLLHPLVPLAAAAAALWLIAGDPLAIETSAPELKKRGV